MSSLNLAGMVITADALHPQHDHTRQIAAGGHYLFIVKGNQPTLLRRLKALPWREAILNNRTDETGHGRREVRRMKIRTARPDLPIPHALPSRSNAAAPPPHRQDHHRHDLRHHQPPTRPDHPHPARRTDPRPLEHRSPAPHPRRHLPRRRLQGENGRSPSLGRSPQPGHRPDPPARLDQYRRRRRPLPQPPRRWPSPTRVHNKRTLRPWARRPGTGFTDRGPVLSSG